MTAYLLFVEEEVHGREVVAEVGGRHELFLLPDPPLLVGHVPVELPQLA